MAVDTRNKRGALLNLGLGKARVLPLADGVIDTSDRVQLALLYPISAIITPPCGGETAYVFVRGLLVATAYANPGGTGDRTATIAVWAVGANSDVSGFHLVNGSAVDAGFYLTTSTGCSIEFWFQSKKIIDEARFTQQNGASHGTWKWQGSNTRTSWTDIGSTFTLGGAATQTFTSLSGNTTGYIFYRLLQTAGTTSSSPYIYEFEFKIDESDTLTYSNPLGSGNRTAAITITSSGITWGAAVSTLVNGDLSNQAWWDSNTNAGHWVQFDFNSLVVLQQARVWFNTTVNQGNWRFEGSLDASTWTDLSGTFALSTTDPSPALIGGFDSNTTAYRYVRLLGISGSRTSSPFLREVEFLAGIATALPVSSERSYLFAS